jgi:murein DD-endopeptidase MepM/ murein hydrolase activator NlpD
MIRSLNDRLGRHVPPLRLFLKSPSATRYAEISPLRQVLSGIAALGFLGWMLVSTSALVVGSIGAEGDANRARALSDAYEARIAALTSERDAALSEAAAAREQFALALAEIETGQDELLAGMGLQEELATEISVIRAKYALALHDRDTAVGENADLIAALDRAKGAEAGVSTSDLSGTLETISLALAAAAEDRDAALAEAETYAAQVAGLQLKIRVNAERQDRMMTRLEEAVTTSFAPLEGMFEAAGLDVGRIVGDVQLSHSGTGGPLTPVMSSKGDSAFSLMEVPVPGIDERFADLLHDMDAVNSLMIAAEGLPFSNPVDGPYRFTSGFGGRSDPKNGGWRQHNGLDFAGSSGTDIVASGDGTVVFAGRQSGYGNMIRIRHSNGYESMYGHLSAISVNVGDHVSRGDHIGDMGNTGRSTGTHLHYEIRLGGNPLNPMTFLEAARNVL